jgi:hypothetical protein
VGEVWHYFDEVIGYPVTLVEPGDVNGGLLADYDVLVMPSGRYGAWLAEDGRAEALAGWVREGGRLVALESAAAALARHDAFALARHTPADSVEAVEGGEGNVRAYAGAEREALRRATPGSVHRTTLDATHPLAFGLGDGYLTLKRSARAYTLPGDGAWRVATLGDGAPLSGFMGSEAQAAIAGSLVAGAERMGRGEVVYLLDDPLFRGFWHAGQLLFGNAVFGGSE